MPNGKPYEVKLSYTGYVTMVVKAPNPDAAIEEALTQVNNLPFGLKRYLDDLERWPCADMVEEVE